MRTPHKVHFLLSYLPFNEYLARHIFSAVTFGHRTKSTEQGQQPTAQLKLVEELFPAGKTLKMS